MVVIKVVKTEENIQLYVPVVWDLLAEQESVFTSSRSLNWKIFSLNVSLMEGGIISVKELSIVK